MHINTSWDDFKSFIVARNLSIQYLDSPNFYYLAAFDGPFYLMCQLGKSESENISDFETNYKPNGNKQVVPTDSDAAVLSRTKMAPTGWSFQMYGVEFKTSNATSLVDEDENGVTMNYALLKFYNAAGALITDPNDVQSLDANIGAVKTVMDWEAPHDIEMLGGILRQVERPTQNVRVYATGVPDVPAAFGGSKKFIKQVNLRFHGADTQVNADGRVSKNLKYDAVYHTNKIRTIIKHPAGYQHEIHMIFLEFKP